MQGFTLKEWFLGVGPKNFTIIKYPENQYLVELVEKGFLGLLSHLLLIGVYFFCGIKTFLRSQGISKAMGWAMICSILTLAQYNLISDKFRHTIPFFLIFLAALATQPKNRETETI